MNTHAESQPQRYSSLSHRSTLHSIGKSQKPMNTQDIYRRNTKRGRAWWPATAGGLAIAGVLLTGTLTAASPTGPLGAWGLWPRGAQAQELDPDLSLVRSGITVVGDGFATARPDSATVRLGVEVTAQTPAAALSQTQQATESVLQRLRQSGVVEANLQTSDLNVFQVQGPGRDGPPIQPTQAGQSGQTPTLYRGHALITIRGQEVDRVAPLLETAIQAGATAVHGLSFGVRDSSSLAREALQAAIRDSRPKAEAAAAEAGLTLGSIRSIVETPLGPPQIRMQGGGAGDGISPGETQVSARVLVTFNVAAGNAIAERTTRFSLATAEGSPVTGVATISERSGRTSLSLDVAGLQPGKTYVAQIHAGTPGQLSASAGRLGELVANAEGRATLTTAAVRVGATGAEVSLSETALADGEHTLVIQLPGAGVLSQTVIPPAGTVTIQ